MFSPYLKLFYINGCKYYNIFPCRNVNTNMVVKHDHLCLRECCVCSITNFKADIVFQNSAAILFSGKPHLPVEFFLIRMFSSTLCVSGGTAYHFPPSANNCLLSITPHPLANTVTLCLNSTVSIRRH